MNKPLTWKEIKHFDNKPPFPSQLRMIISGSSGAGKTKLLLKYLLDGTLDYNKLVLVSPTLQQAEYQVLIKGMKSGLSREQILTLFQEQDEVGDLDKAFATIKSKSKTKSNIEIVTYDNVEKLPDPHLLNPNSKLKVLVCIDDSTIAKHQEQVLKVFTQGRPVNVNAIFLSQKYTKVQTTIRENTNVFILWKQTTKAIHNHIFTELGEAFETEDECLKFFKQHLREKHDYLIYIKDKQEWYNPELNLIKIEKLVKSVPSQEVSRVEDRHNQPVNRMAGNPEHLKYLKEKEKVYRMQLANRAVYKNQQQFERQLFEQQSLSQKPTTEAQKKTTEALTGENYDPKDPNAKKPLMIQVRDELKEVQTKLEPLNTIATKLGNIKVIPKKEEAAKTDVVLKEEPLDKFVTTKDASGYPPNADAIYDFIRRDITSHNWDAVFGLVRSPNTRSPYPLEFGITDDLRERKLLKPEQEYKIFFENRLVGRPYLAVEKANGDREEFDLTNDLMTMLFYKEYTPKLDTTIPEYFQILFSVLKDNLLSVRDRAKLRNAPEAEILEIMESSPKYIKYIAPRLDESKAGKGLRRYRDMANDKIMIPNNSDKMFRRLMVLMASLKSGNNNPNLLKEVSALLDELLSNKKIDKKDYKILYYKSKDLLRNNLSVKH